MNELNMWIPLVLCGVALLIGISVHLRLKHQRYEVAREGNQQSVSHCGMLMQLIKDIQQHRGMSSACLSGDVSFLPRREEKRRQIESIFSVLSQMANEESAQSCPCFTHNDWVLFRHQWRELVEGLPKLTVDQSIARHSQLIVKLLEWLANIGESRIEPLAIEKAKIGVSRNFTHRLPQLTECLGQARAIGTGVAAQHSCPPVARVRLLFLISRAESLLDQAISAHGGGLVTVRAQQTIREMVATVRTRMLYSSGVVVTPSEYFALASRAIDQVFDWIHVCEEETREFSKPEDNTLELSAC